jgi:hypothetical protein
LLLLLLLLLLGGAWAWEATYSAYHQGYA